MVDDLSFMPPWWIEAAISGKEELLTAPKPADLEAQNTILAENIEKIDHCLLEETSLCPVLHIASSRGHAQIVEKICNKEKTLLPNKIGYEKSWLLMSRDQMGNSALHCAARAGHTDMVEKIIKLVKEVLGRRPMDEALEFSDLQKFLRIKNRNGDIALHEAARHAHTEVTRKLMKEDAESASKVNNAGVSPLYLAVMARSLETVELLTSPKASYDGPLGKTALHAAVLLRKDLAKRLLEWRKDLDQKCDNDESVPLHYAASYNDGGIVDLLLKHNASTAYRRDKAGNFPIHIAASMGNVDVIRVILKECRGTYKLLDKKGRSFLHVAIEKRRRNILRFVKSKPKLVELFNAQDYEGNTPLHLAAKIADQISMIQLSLHGVVRGDIINNDSRTPLDLALKSTTTGIAKVCVIEIMAIMRSVFSPKRQDRPNSENPQQADSERANSTNSERVNSENPQQANFKLKEEKVFERFEKYASGLSVVSAVIMSVTFSTGLALPKGFQSEDHKVSDFVKWFIFFDSWALHCSSIATALLICSRFVSDHLWMIAVGSALILVLWALLFTGMAFIMGIYAIGNSYYGASLTIVILKYLWDLSQSIFLIMFPLLVWPFVLVIKKPDLRPLVKLIKKPALTVDSYERKGGKDGEAWKTLPFGFCLKPDATSIHLDSLCGILFLGYCRKTIYRFVIVGCILFLILAWIKLQCLDP